MAAIAQLTAKLARRFWGGGNINPGSTYDLGAELDEIRAKINAIITGSGHLTALSVGGADEAVYGTTGEKAKVNADGVNPLTLEAIKILGSRTRGHPRQGSALGQGAELGLRGRRHGRPCPHRPEAVWQLRAASTQAI
jgi:hypothetical protein